MKQICNVIILLSLISLSAQSPAQTAPIQQWDKTFGGNLNDYLYCIRQTTDGGYILGGYSTSDSSGDKTEASKGTHDYWVIKIDANGVKQWDKSFGGNNLDLLKCLQQTSDGGYILGGSSASDSSGDKSENSKGKEDFWVVKIDANGVKQWDKTFGGIGNDGIASLQQTTDGGYILGGYSSSPAGGDKTESCRGFWDFWVIKIDASGTKQWDKTYGGSEMDEITCLRQTTDGGFILGGHSSSSQGYEKTEYNRGVIDYWIVKTDANGIKQWDKTYGGLDADLLFAIEQTADGGYMLGGASQSDTDGDKSDFSNGVYDYWVIKTDSSGAKQWDHGFGGWEYDNLFTLQQTTDGNYILGGASSSGTWFGEDKTEESRGGEDFWIIKITSNGFRMWDKTFGGSGNDELRFLQQTPDGGFILGGFSESSIGNEKSENSRGYYDYWIIKTGPECRKTTYYRDADSDGFGDANNSIIDCSQPSGYVTNNTDCDDSKALYVDNDGDGYGSGTPVACGVDNNFDCNDNDSSIHPNAIEICGNGVDNNCDGQIDEGCQVDNVMIFVKDAAISEGNRSTKSAKFRVKMTQKSSDTVYVNYSTVDGTAIAGEDYLAQSGTVVFPPHTKKAFIYVSIMGDKIIEPDETFSVILSDPVNTEISDGIASATILNDDHSTASASENQAMQLESGKFARLYPNPATHSIFIELIGYAGDITIQVLTVEGRMVSEKKLSGVGKSEKLQFDVTKLPNGNYFVNIFDDKGNRNTVKFIVAH